jgi:TolA-binding protein
MLIIEIKGKDSIERALKMLKSKVIKTKQQQKLFDKKQYVASQKSFTDYLNLNTGIALLKTDAEYYAAACAIELFHKDGEWRMREFITKHPESNKQNGAWFYLGKSSFRKKKYEEKNE